MNPTIRTALTVSVWFLTLSDPLSSRADETVPEHQQKTESTASEPSAHTDSDHPSMMPKLSIILDATGAYFSHDNHFRQGGHAPRQTGPSIQGAELGFSADVDRYFTIDMAFALSHLHLEEIFFTTQSLLWHLRIRGGRYKAKVGMHNATHLHSWAFVSQPLANEWMFGAEGLTLPGIELAWSPPLAWEVEIIGGMQIGNAGAFRSRSFSDDEPNLSDFIFPLRLVQQFEMTPALSFQFGINTVLGTSDIGPENQNRSYAYGVDWELKWHRTHGGAEGDEMFKWQTETWMRQMEVPGEVWNDIGGYSAFLVGITEHFEGAFRTELWRQLNRSQSLNRNGYGIDSFKLSVAVSYLLSHFSRLRLQHNVETIEGYPTVQSTFLQMEVSAGAHRAHADAHRGHEDDHHGHDNDHPLKKTMNEEEKK